MRPRPHSAALALVAATALAIAAMSAASPPATAWTMTLGLLGLACGGSLPRRAQRPRTLRPQIVITLTLAERSPA